MKGLIVIDAQNEFSANGKRTVPNFDHATQVIAGRVAEARRDNPSPISA
jgi:nicotinamidase-related amidase